ncbi:hypothetical protein BSG1_09036 [Bacillus sp. SG-1]|nr:hypothetical protein BSG1_09036 [Bacillus sp. SG-1]
MFLREKKEILPFILSGLFDPEGLGTETRRPANPAGGRAPSATISKCLVLQLLIKMGTNVHMASIIPNFLY